MRHGSLRGMFRISVNSWGNKSLPYKLPEEYLQTARDHILPVPTQESYIRKHVEKKIQKIPESNTNVLDFYQHSGLFKNALQMKENNDISKRFRSK